MGASATARDLLRLARLLLRANFAARPRVPALAPGRATVRVMTYNVNYEMPSPARTVEAIRTSGCDVVCLQETTPAWERLLRGELTEAYPHMVFAGGEEDAGGLAALSRRPLQQTAWIAPPAEGTLPAAVVAADTPLGTLHVLHVHLTSPSIDADAVRSFLGTLRLREGEIRAFWPHMPADGPGVVLGDFNEGDWGFALDWLRRRGWQDALWPFERHRPTWRYSLCRRWIRERLDHVVHSPDLLAVAAEVRHVGGSDHYPVVATLAPRA